MFKSPLLQDSGLFCCPAVVDPARSVWLPEPPRIKKQPSAKPMAVFEPESKTAR
jgi:hypothetical protein